MTWRRMTKDEARALKVGDRVAIYYFDPHGPKRNRDTNMTTDPGVVTRITGDPVTWTERTIWVRPDDFTAPELDYFYTSLLVEGTP